MEKEYLKKRINIEDVGPLIGEREHIFISGNAAIPMGILRVLASTPNKPKGVTISHMLMVKPEPTTQKGLEKFFRHNSLFVGPDDREAVAEGRADYVPCHLNDIPYFISTGIIPVDTAIIHVSPPDKNGFFSLGVEILANLEAVRSAKRVIAQVNPNMPRVLGDTFVHISQIHYIVEHEEELVEIKEQTPTEVELKIAKYVNELIEDGSTLQIGIGSIPTAIISMLEGKRDLGIHSEMMGDGVMNAIKRGIITCAKKTINKGKVVASFFLGTKELYKFIHDNPFIEGHPANYTNNPHTISKHEKMVSINSAIEVDITGQVCADSIGARIYSGFGGQVDFVRGAALSKGGKPIIALPSTTRNGEFSRIVPFLRQGAGVVTTRADVHYVITEYGIANLFGRNLRQRAQALISISHPKFREELEKYAFERNLIPHTHFISRT